MTCDQAVASWYAGQRERPAEDKLTPAVRRALSRDDLNVVPHVYRPFVHGHAIIDSGVFDALSAAPGDGTRPRSEVIAAFSAGARALVVAPAPRDLGPTMKRFVCFAPHISDNDIPARGNGMVHADREASPNSQGGITVVSNVRPEAEALFPEADDPALEMLLY